MLELLHESTELPAGCLPERLRDLYGGDLGFPQPCLYANFVETIDGTVAIPAVERSNKLISGGSQADRFVMGVLRAFADVVLIGAGTLRASPNALWRPERVFPDAATEFAELRSSLGKAPHPLVAVMTQTGAIDPAAPLLEAGALVLTSEQGAAALRPSAPAATEVVALGGEVTVDPGVAVEELHRRGHRLICSEAGPAVFGALAAAGLVDELFLTVSPFLAGGDRPGSRLSLGEGISILPTQRLEGELLSVRRHEAYLFLRYRLGRGPVDAR
jgi:riboflavin biosynthesis pyrimidine reductase